METSTPPTTAVTIPATIGNPDATAKPSAKGKAISDTTNPAKILLRRPVNTEDLAISAQLKHLWVNQIKYTLGREGIHDPKACVFEGRSSPINRPVLHEQNDQ